MILGTYFYLRSEKHLSFATSGYSYLNRSYINFVDTTHSLVSSAEVLVVGPQSFQAYNFPGCAKTQSFWEPQFMSATNC